MNKRWLFRQNSWMYAEEYFCSISAKEHHWGSTGSSNASILQWPTSLGSEFPSIKVSKSCRCFGIIVLYRLDDFLVYLLLSWHHGLILHKIMVVVVLYGIRNDQLSFSLPPWSWISIDTKHWYQSWYQHFPIPHFQIEQQNQSKFQLKFKNVIWVSCFSTILLFYLRS